MLIHLQSCLIGGGFGGKETRFSPLTTTIAVAANKYNACILVMKPFHIPIMQSW